VAIAAAGLSAQGGEALAGDDGDHDQGRQRVGPPPAYERIQEQAAEQDGGEVRAQAGLARVGVQGATVEASGDGAFGPGEQGHDGERGDGEGDPGGAVFGGFAAEESRDGLGGDVGGEGEKADADYAQRALLVAFAMGGIGITVQAPEEGCSGGDLDGAIDAEPYEGDAACGKSGGDSDQAFQAVVEDGEVFEAAAADEKDGPVCGGGGCHSFQFSGRADCWAPMNADERLANPCLAHDPPGCAAGTNSQWRQPKVKSGSPNPCVYGGVNVSTGVPRADQQSFGNPLGTYVVSPEWAGTTVLRPSWWRRK
jgi:hypothetical protein